MKNKILDIISGILDIDKTRLEESQDIISDFAVNSLKIMQIVDALEDSFDVRINLKNEAVRLKSVEGIEKLIGEKTNAS